MVRKFVSAAASAALCLMSLAPGVAAAQEYRFSGYDAPRGATATVNLRVPLGTENRERATYGLTVGYGQEVGMQDLSGRTTARAVNVADFRFSGNELRNARIATFDLANLDQDRRMNLDGGGKKTWLIIGAILVGGIVICLAADCFDDDDSSSSSSSSN